MPVRFIRLATIWLLLLATFRVIEPYRTVRVDIADVSELSQG